MPPETISTAIVPLDRVQSRILIIRGQRVILGADLAHLYGVTTKRLNEQVSRNARRFPEDFMFQLSREEAAALRSQFATLKNAPPEATLRSQFATSKRGAHAKYRPYAFTEHGAIMASTVLNSPRAIDASVFVVRAFVKLRELLASHVQLAAKLEELERKLQNHDDQIIAIADAIRQLMQPPEEPPKEAFGFHAAIALPRRVLSKKRKVFKSRPWTRSCPIDH